MKIIMTETKQGSENGIVVKTYYKSETYNIGQELYNSFKKMKCCKDFVEVEQFEEPKQKKIEVSENKMVKSKENKNIIKEEE